MDIDQGGNGDDGLSADLIQRLSCLNTNDRDELVAHLKQFLGSALNDEHAQFWLEMNNWNLQAAICAYFDYDQATMSNQHMMMMNLCMKFVSDVTIGEGEEVPPNSRFTKTWRIANNGEETWPPGCCLRFFDGDQLCHTDRVLVDQLAPNETTDVSVEMLSPQSAGIYQGQWRMVTPTGQSFGDVIWVIITVSEGGLLTLTQQMSNLHDLGMPSPIPSFSSQQPIQQHQHNTHQTQQQHQLVLAHSPHSNRPNPFAASSVTQTNTNTNCISTTNTTTTTEHQHFTSMSDNDDQSMPKMEETNDGDGNDGWN